MHYFHFNVSVNENNFLYHFLADRMDLFNANYLLKDEFLAPYIIASNSTLALLVFLCDKITNVGQFLHSLGSAAEKLESNGCSLSDGEKSRKFIQFENAT
jgi:hypothetical protein